MKKSHICLITLMECLIMQRVGVTSHTTVLCSSHWWSKSAEETFISVSVAVCCRVNPWVKVHRKLRLKAEFVIGSQSCISRFFVGSASTGHSVLNQTHKDLTYPRLKAHDFMKTRAAGVTTVNLVWTRQTQLWPCPIILERISVRSDLYSSETQRLLNCHKKLEK